jgi:hypothetical protein
MGALLEVDRVRGLRASGGRTIARIVSWSLVESECGYSRGDRRTRPPIPVGEITRLFEPFQQLSSQNANSPAGLASASASPRPSPTRTAPSSARKPIRSTTNRCRHWGPPGDDNLPASCPASAKSLTATTSPRTPSSPSRSMRLGLTHTGRHLDRKLHNGGNRAQRSSRRTRRSPRRRSPTPGITSLPGAAPAVQQRLTAP